ncbi:sulfurtransferase [Limnohabitans sp. MMS-10A-178]|jgi:thiosulfate/3-mercaptopyruvate sulfurtransferase|uniref:sulfurtransferase n=1 Tax=Limnohabitans sp. MMS-10A-178 TaxID=1835767 RepID=UPI000D33BA49|nr:sulfurtransferase [Limnohabitans sp. MMS-10A-178]PUE17030.1 sulfurtransferase [Limnohabitans sp. MMS-10A-178]
MYTTLISAEQLKALQASGQPLMIFDCSFELMKPEMADIMFSDVRIQGAQQAHLDRNLSCRDGSGVNGGRNPLPARESLSAWLGGLGFQNKMQAVVYDRNGANYCGRLWWMLKWLGHDAVAVLNGGLQAWQAAGGAVESGAPATTPAQSNTFELKPALREWLSTAQLAPQVGHPEVTLIDARSPVRFRGEMEPIDPVAGHIPGALNRPFAENLDANGFFKSAEVLRAEFEKLLGGRKPESVVHYCGSGVSTLPNLLAMELAGLGSTRLYPGSWSEWSGTPGLPCAKS